jgi:hypothetical protein
MRLQLEDKRTLVQDHGQVCHGELGPRTTDSQISVSKHSMLLLL